MGFGGRTYLVGQALNHTLRRHTPDLKGWQMAVDDAITIADMTQEKMQWPNGKPSEQLDAIDRIIKEGDAASEDETPPRRKG